MKSTEERLALLQRKCAELVLANRRLKDEMLNISSFLVGYGDVAEIAARKLREAAMGAKK